MRRATVAAALSGVLVALVIGFLVGWRTHDWRTNESCAFAEEIHSIAVGREFRNLATTGWPDFAHIEDEFGEPGANRLFMAWYEQPAAAGAFTAVATDQACGTIREREGEFLALMEEELLPAALVERVEAGDERVGVAFRHGYEEYERLSQIAHAAWLLITGELDSLLEEEPTDGPASALTVELLRNGTYPSGWTDSGSVTLVDGTFKKSYEDPVFTLTVRLLDEIGRGDLDGDGNSDAAVVIATNGGGSGTFHELVVVLNRDGSPFPVATESLGDRVIIDSISIVAGRIELDMTTHGTGDALCCPSSPVSRVYVLGDSGLLLLDEVGRLED